MGVRYDYRGRLILSAFIRDLKVERFMPSNCAAFAGDFPAGGFRGANDVVQAISSVKALNRRLLFDILIEVENHF